MRRAVLLVSLIPGIAFAQGAPPPEPPPPPTSGAPLPPADPAAPAPPAYPTAPPPPAYPTAPAPAPAPPPTGYYQPQPMYGPPPVQPAPSLRNGMTFEANLGLGWIQASADGESDTSDLGIGGLSLGVGGWVNPNVAITVRLAGVTLSENDARLSNIFLGPSIQYWANDHFWLGGGLGLGILAASNDIDSDSITGLGLDLRVGYTFTSGSENTFNVSFELNPGRFEENGSSATLTGIGLLFGYQHL